jgi:hypothetical protein
VRRLALAFVVALLAFSVSGASALLVAEPCTGFERPGTTDAACPPTCVTCGCCVQAVEPLTVAIASTPDILITDIAAVLPHFGTADPRPILHVPKPIAS